MSSFAAPGGGWKLATGNWELGAGGCPRPGCGFPSPNWATPREHSEPSPCATPNPHPRLLPSDLGEENADRARDGDRIPQRM